jgi:pimeloyl-ACP methyl ester carboxylesterase
MPNLENDGASLYYEISGSGDPMVLVHGSWVDHYEWPFVLPALAESYRVLIYDRRGHTQSTAPEGQGSINEDLADLAAMIEEVGAPAHVVASSFGSSISLNLAARRPELFRTLCAHEPPLFDLLAASEETRPVYEQVRVGVQAVEELIAAGRNEDAARTFVNDVALGPGFWDFIPEEDRRRIIANAPTFLDERRDPDSLKLDASVARFDKPALLTNGDQSPPPFALTITRLKEVFPAAEYRTIPGWGHVPHVTHPQDYVEMVKAFAQSS